MDTVVVILRISDRKIQIKNLNVQKHLVFRPRYENPEFDTTVYCSFMNSMAAVFQFNVDSLKQYIQDCGTKNINGFHFKERLVIISMC